MTVSINQPAYLPWLGYFHRIAISDLHIVLNHVQFEKNSFTNRNKVRTSNGSCWLTVPVRTGGKFGALPIREVEIDNNSNWCLKHWRTIAQNYAKAPFFDKYANFFEGVYTRKWVSLAELCAEITDFVLRSFAIATPLKQSTELDPQESKGELILELCQKVGATTYITGILGRDYLDEPSFARAGIELVFQDFRHPEYTQCKWDGFIPYLAAIDLLFNYGPNSCEHIAPKKLLPVLTRL